MLWTSRPCFCVAATTDSSSPVTLKPHSQVTVMSAMAPPGVSNPSTVARQSWRSVGSVARVLRIYLTGRVAVEADGVIRSGPALGTGQLCALLAIVAAERHRAVADGELAEHLWPEGPPAAWQQALRSLVSKLRGRLPAVTGVDPVPHWMGCYQLVAGPGIWVD